MKAITKLVFVALLIAISMSMPSRSRAQSSQLICNWVPYSQCYSSLTQWMNTCTRDCTQYAGYTGNQQACYSLIYLGGSTMVQDSNGNIKVSVTETDMNVCFSSPNNGSSCLSNCVTQYNAQMNNCISANCSSN